MTSPKDKVEAAMQRNHQAVEQAVDAQHAKLDAAIANREPHAMIHGLKEAPAQPAAATSKHREAPSLPEHLAQQAASVAPKETRVVVTPTEERRIHLKLNEKRVHVPSIEH